MNLSDADWRLLELAFSSERLKKHLDLVGGDLASAVRLHQLDAVLAAELTVPLKMIELTIRNVIHRTIREVRANEFWFRAPGFEWRKLELDKLARAEKLAGNYSGSAIAAGDVIAQITLGFWVRCFASAYENELWHPHLKALFPDRRIKRGHVHDRLESLLLIRNRVAHHESIFPTRAEKAVADVRFLLSNLRAWEHVPDDIPATLRILEPSLATIGLRIEEMHTLMVPQR